MADLDLSALRRTPTRAELADLRRRARAGEFGPRASRLAAYLFVGFVIALMACFAWFSRGLMLNVRGPFGQTSTVPSVGWFGALWFGIFGLGVVIFLGSVIKGMANRNDWAKLALFARANNLGFRRSSADPSYPGILFSYGDSRRSLDHVWAPTGLLADAGTYEYTTGSGEDRSTTTKSFAAFRLPRPLPHLVLDARPATSLKTNTISYPFRADQRITLGQPFDSHYTLYGPQGYGRDIFQLFPPDLMDHLISIGAMWDIEIVDDWLFLYADAVDFTEPETWQTLQFVENTVVARLARLADRYVDDRAALAPVSPLAGLPAGPGRPVAPAIAEQGRRLRTSWVGGVITVGVMFALWFIGQWAMRTFIFPTP